MKDPGTRTYRREECAVFRKTTERFGGLSNMAAGFPLEVNGIRIRTSEALYQACRFPHRPELQRIVLAEASPMTAKMRTKPHRKDTRPDWDDVRITIMRWALRVKLAQHLESFGQLLLATGDGAIVEESRRDEFWGARPRPDGTLVGANVMGRLLRELRDELKSGKLSPGSIVEPPALEQFVLCERPIEAMQVREPRHAAVAGPAARPRPVQRPLATAPGLLVAPSRPASIPRVAATPTAGETPDMTKTRKKLIEVALPLPEINDASAYDKMPGIGPHPKGIHQWWARLPLPTARAVLFASVVDDPSEHPDRWPSEEAQAAERERLFDIVRRMMEKKLHEHPEVYAEATAEMLKHVDGRMPAVFDPFAGGGTIPLEANRLGFEAHAGDLNPVAVLLNRCNLELAPAWSGHPAVNPEDRKSTASDAVWSGLHGLAADVRYYGRLVRSRALQAIGHLYPTVSLPKEQGDGDAGVIAWIWARTVASPNPAARGTHVPLVSTYWLSSKKGSEAWLEPLVDKAAGRWEFGIRNGPPSDRIAVAAGTKVGKGGFRCLLTDAPIPFDYIRTEGREGRLGFAMLAVVAERPRGRIYVPANPDQTDAAARAVPSDPPDSDLPEEALGFRVQNYGIRKHWQMFTPRQLVALLTLSDLIKTVRNDVISDASSAGLTPEQASSYGRAVTTFLALALDRCADFNNALTRWKASGQQSMSLFGRQAIPMVWDFVEANVMGQKAVCWYTAVDICADAVETIFTNTTKKATARQIDAASGIPDEIGNVLVSTDPPYYDNIGYGALSDFFYVWLRRTIGDLHGDIFGTMLVPKVAELTAAPERFDGNKDKAKEHFESGFRKAFSAQLKQMDLRFPLTVYYAFKQDDEEASGDHEDTGQIGVDRTTGWETLLEALVASGFQITGTWPVRASQAWRMRAMGSNALASYIVLACRPRSADAQQTDRRSFVAELKRELPAALRHLQQGNIAPVDFAQAAIGPGMAVYSQYSRVLESSGKPMSVRAALSVINQTLTEVLSEQEDDFDGDTRWAISWFEQKGFAEGDFGEAELLSKAKVTSVSGLQQAGVIQSKGGKVRLLRPEELSPSWDPATDKRLTIWEMTHQLVRVYYHEKAGDEAAGRLLAQMGSNAEIARELAYRLFDICEKKKRPAEALAYNALVLGWPEIAHFAREAVLSQPQQPRLIREE